MQLNYRHVMAVGLALVTIGATAVFLNSTPATAGRSLRRGSGHDATQTDGGLSLRDGDSKPQNLPKVTIEVQPPTTREEFLVALRSIIPDSNTHRHRKGILDLMESLTPEDAAAVREEFRKLKEQGFGSDFAWWAFCARWGEIDPQGAFAYFREHPSDPGATTAANHLMEGWVAVDDRAARAWLTENRESPLFRAALWSYTTTMAGRDLNQATSDLFALNLDAESLYNNVGPLVKGARDRGGFEGIANWFDGLTGPQKMAAFEHAMWGMKDAELTISKDWFAANADKPWRSDKHFHHIASRYAAQDPRAALEWAMSLPDDPGRPGIPAGLSTIIDVWTLKDFREAGTWLNQHSDELWWPRAAMGHYRSLVRNNPGAAEQFIAGLPPERRGAVLRQLEGN